MDVRTTGLLTSEHSDDELYQRTRDSFGDALRRAMTVAGETEDGKPTKVTQSDLSERSGISRSSIAKYLATGTDEGDAANPDLKTLCRLAHALNVPPAYLLMRPEDWRRLAQAAAAISIALRDDEVQAISTAASQSRHSPVDRSLAGLQLAKRLGVAPSECRVAKELTSSEAALATDQLNDRSRLGVFTTCALPPLGQMAPEYYAPLLSLCATIGATN
ncbi:helix-turn-helix transcriptional regulator [Paraburkholderia sp. SIMBA_049]